MKKIEIKEIGVKSAFKTTLYVLCIPLALMMCLGVLITIIGAAIGEGVMLGMGIPYIIMPVFMIGIYGAINMLVALVYNLFAKKFGGLELVIAEKNDVAFVHNSYQQNYSQQNYNQQNNNPQNYNQPNNNQ